MNIAASPWPGRVTIGRATRARRSMRAGSRRVGVNASAVERRAATLTTRRSVKKE